MDCSHLRRLVIAIAVAATAGTASAQHAQRPDIELEGDTFRAGPSVELSDPITGDALLAGGRVESNASVGGDATVAGGQVVVRATVGDDLYAAGGTVEIDALVHGNARIAAGRVRILPESRIEGGTAIAGRIVDIAGEFGRYLSVAGGDVTLGGEVAGNVRVYADSLTLLPGTRIGGSLSYRTVEDVVLPEDLEVSGGILRDDEIRGAPLPEEQWRGADATGRIGWLWLAGLFAIGLLLALRFAAFTHQVTRVLSEKPWAGMIAGFLVLACVPFIAFGLAITLIGIPLALIMLLLYFALLIAAYVAGALFIGDRVLAATGRDAQAVPELRLAALFLILVALAFLRLVPVAGFLARTAVLLLGMGGIVMAMRVERIHSRLKTS